MDELDSKYKMVIGVEEIMNPKVIKIDAKPGKTLKTLRLFIS